MHFRYKGPMICALPLEFQLVSPVSKSKDFHVDPAMRAESPWPTLIWWISRLPDVQVPVPQVPAASVGSGAKTKIDIVTQTSLIAKRKVVILIFPILLSYIAEVDNMFIHPPINVVRNKCASIPNWLILLPFFREAGKAEGLPYLSANSLLTQEHVNCMVLIWIDFPYELRSSDHQICSHAYVIVGSEPVVSGKPIGSNP